MKPPTIDTARAVPVGSQNSPARLPLSAAQVGTRDSMSASSVYRHAGLRPIPPVRIGKLIRQSVGKWEADGVPIFRTSRTSTPSSAIVPIWKPLRCSNEKGPAA